MQVRNQNVHRGFVLGSNKEALELFRAFCGFMFLKKVFLPIHFHNSYLCAPGRISFFSHRTMKHILKIFPALLFLVCISVGYTQEEDTTTEWPRILEGERGKVTIYQPQIETFANDKMDARAAISVTTPENPAPVFGAVWFECRMETDRDERTVSLLDATVAAAKFPEAKEENVQKLIDLLEEEIPKWDIVLSLDRLLADLEMDEQGLLKSEHFNNDPPEILFRTTPSVLVLIDGDPIWEKTGEADFEVVVNTPYLIIREKEGLQYHLKGGDHWYASTALLENWKYNENPSEKLKKLAEEMIEPEEDNEEAVGAEVDSIIPDILVRTRPAELLQSGGDPSFEPIPETSLLFMKNTGDDIIMDINTQRFFVLIAGRWYSSNSMTSGEWDFIPPNELPEEFLKIPEDSEMGSIRSSVAGTQEARDAVLENQIPQTAEVSRTDATLEVKYDGKPEFKPIEGTSMLYAVNTESSVLLIDGKYFCCDNAVWFESRSADGPWAVCVDVPEDVREIPPENPNYNVKYVYVYDYTPTVVYVGYTPGYVHSYVYMGTVYYGTGWWYHPWYRTVYYPRPVTYGFGVHYNPYTGWGFSMTASRGWFTISYRSHPGYWGPSGYRYGYRHGYHHGYRRGAAAGYRAGYASARRSAASNNVYRNRSNGVARTGGQNYNPRNGQTVTPSNPARTRQQPQRGGGSNNVYTDKNGNVYRREGNQWQSRESGQWKDAGSGTRDVRNTRQTQNQTGNYNRSGSAQQRNYNDLNRDANARSRGTQRSNNYNQNRQNYQYQRSGGSRSRGGARPAGGQRR
jgi:hypothetical protein